MTSGGDQLTVLVVIVCLIFGYAIMSLAIRGVSRIFGKPPAESGTATAEQECRAVLGVSPSAGDAEIEAAYLSLLARYDPLKIASMGEEFHDLAAARTRKITEAYEYLQRHRKTG